MRKHKGHVVHELPTNYVIIDVETTGLDPSKDELIEVAALKIMNNSIVDSFSSLINPGIEISDFITNLTGISNTDLISAPCCKDVLNLLKDFISDDILIGHNVHFDINFLYDNFEKYCGFYLTNNLVDTLRLSRKYFSLAPSQRLSELAKYLQIPSATNHRALADCNTTYSLYQKLQEAYSKPSDSEISLLDSLSFDESNPFYNKKIALKGMPTLYTYSFMSKVAEKCCCTFSGTFSSDSDYIIFSKYTYNSYKAGNESIKFEKADRLAAAGSLTILSEYDWCNLLGIPIPEKPCTNKKPHKAVSAKDIIPTNTDFDETHPLYNKTCVFTGALERMTRKEAMQIVADLGGLNGNTVTKSTDFLILGNNDYCPSIIDGKSSKQKKAEALKLAGSPIEILSENVFYDMISDE